MDDPDITSHNCDRCKIRHEKCDRSIWGCLNCAKRGIHCLYSTTTAKELVNRRSDPTALLSAFELRAQDTSSAAQIGHSSLTSSIVQIFDGVLQSNSELRRFLLWKDGLWNSGAYQPPPRLAANDLVSCFPLLSTTQALVEVFLERVNPHAWLFSEGEMMSVVSELEKDPSRVHVCGLCSLLLVLVVATHYQAPTATVKIHADIRWENTVFLYIDEVLAKAAQNPLWAIRVCVLLTLNGMSARKNSCWNYHGIAVSLAESYCPDLSEDGAESELSIGWHRVVRTLSTLDTWLSVSFGLGPKIRYGTGFLASSLPLRVDDDLGLPLHAAWFRLSRIVADISRRMYTTTSPSPETFESALHSLESWRLVLPQMLRPEVGSSSWLTLDMWERYLLIQLHMAYLSALMLLLLPVLVIFAQKNAKPTEVQNQESRPAFMARFALETAVVHSRFASVRADEGIFLPKSWLDVHGVFLASLILLLGGFWSYETHAAEQMSVTPHQLQEARQQCLRVIQSCATDDPVSKVLSLVLQNMASAIDRRGVRVGGDPMQADSQSTCGSSFVDTNTLSTLQQNEGIDLSSCSFFLLGGRSPDYEQEVKWEWESHSEAFQTLANYISRNMAR